MGYTLQLNARQGLYSQEDGVASPTKIIDADGSIDVTLSPGSVGATQLATDAVTADKILADAVTTAKILNANVTTAKLADDAVTSAKMDPSLIKSATVAVSSAELLALFTTPKTILAAPGAFDYYEILSVHITYTFVTTAYTIGSATNFNLNYTNAAGATTVVNLASTGFIDQGSTQYRILKPDDANITPVLNAPMVLTLGGANPTLGDGTLSVTVYYRDV